MAGVRPLHLGALFAAGAALSPLVYTLGRDYQRARFESWLHPDRDPLGTGFNILQAEISIGSGGFLGKGFTQGSQTQLDYLRTQTTDYIFSVGEAF
jgi:rod shape determining protein RodA